MVAYEEDFSWHYNVAFILFFFVGCGADDKFQFCEHIKLRVEFSDTNDVVFTQDNILDVDTAIYDDALGYWCIIFQLDSVGTANFDSATASANKGKQLFVIVTANNEDSTIIAPIVNEHITDGKVKITGAMDEQQVQAIIDQLSGKYCNTCNPAIFE